MDTTEQFSITALVDSEYTNFYISQIFVEKEKINIQKYESTITCYNTHSIQNKAGIITDFVEMRLDIGNYSKQIYLVITETKKGKFISGI